MTLLFPRPFPCNLNLRAAGITRRIAKGPRGHGGKAPLRTTKTPIVTQTTAPRLADSACRLGPQFGQRLEGRPDGFGVRRLVSALQFEFLARSDQNTAKRCQATALQKLLLNSLETRSEIHVDRKVCHTHTMEVVHECTVHTIASRSACARPTAETTARGPHALQNAAETARIPTESDPIGPNRT